MLKFVVVLVRKANWDAASFRSYFVDVHGPMARRIPGLRQYRQNFPVPDANRSHPRWDGVIELYFDDYESMHRAWQSPEGVRATKDLEVFADLALSSWSVVDEITIGLENNNPRDPR